MSACRVCGDPAGAALYCQNCTVLGLYLNLDPRALVGIVALVERLVANRAAARDLTHRDALLAAFGPHGQG